MQASSTPVEVGAPGANLSAPDPTQAGQLAAMQSKLDAVMQKQAKLEAQERLTARANSLRQRGFTEDYVSEFKAQAKKHGEKHAMAYAAAMERFGPQDPPITWAGEVRSEPPLPKEVERYAQLGPEKLEKARQLFKSYKATGSEIPLDRYLEINMDPDAFLGVAAK